MLRGALKPLRHPVTVLAQSRQQPSRTDSILVDGHNSTINKPTFGIRTKDIFVSNNMLDPTKETRVHFCVMQPNPMQSHLKMLSKCDTRQNPKTYKSRQKLNKIVGPKAEKRKNWPCRSEESDPRHAVQIGMAYMTRQFSSFPPFFSLPFSVVGVVTACCPEAAA
jgi:hypothetical protein